MTDFGEPLPCSLQDALRMARNLLAPRAHPFNHEYTACRQIDHVAIPSRESVLAALDHAHALMEAADVDHILPNDDAFNRIGCMVAELRGDTKDGEPR